MPTRGTYTVLETDDGRFTVGDTIPVALYADGGYSLGDDAKVPTEPASPYGTEAESAEHAIGTAATEPPTGPTAWGG